MELRVAVAAGVLREDGDRDLMGVLEPSGLHAVDPPAVVPGAHIGGLALHVPDVQPDRLLDLRPDPGRPGLPLRRRPQVAGLPGLDSRRQRGRVRQ